MKVFCTGASGYIGGSVAAHLAAAGHQVTGLVRSQEKADAVRARGIEPLLGTLEDGERLAHAAQAADIVVNAAIILARSRPCLVRWQEAASRSSTLRDLASSARAPMAAGPTRSLTRASPSRQRLPAPPGSR
jgi:uncharacterized protein YbjT (DUF2867 family)